MDYEKLSYEDIHKLILDDEEKYNEIPIEILRKKLYEHQIYVWYTSGAFIGYDISNYTISSEKLSLRKKIINYLCGESNLSSEFKELLEVGGLTVNEGFKIKNLLFKYVVSNIDLDILFHDYYLFLYKVCHGIITPEPYVYDDDYATYNVYEASFENFTLEDLPLEKLEAYQSNKSYLNLVDKQFPQNIDEAINEIIIGLNEESVIFGKISKKYEFKSACHFGVGMYIRNNFGLNSGKSINLIKDLKKYNNNIYSSDSVSSFLIGQVWEEIQRDFDSIIKTKVDENNNFYK